MKAEINPAVIVGAIVVVVLIVVVLGFKVMGKSDSGPNPYSATNAPKGMQPGKPVTGQYIGAQSQGRYPGSGGGYPGSGGQ